MCGNYARQPALALRETVMIRATYLLRQPVGLFSLSSVLALGGLAVRSCHPASEALMIPLCSGQTMMLETGQAGLVHCAGCYVAAAGFVGLLASAGWKYLSRG